ncbi:VIP36 protein-like [Tropilaelaps mercedesae]|uniref:VIP36 protein-like n=1 Tax=Tropilaelaps mercedesae TaxID=418985 RepID=A0A1V9XV17_9ACAR|nr:VIP36 protein-like [Tropilaelaps mercedesae]
MWKVVALLLGSCLVCRGFADDWNRQYVKKEHSLVKPYQGSGMNMPNWDFTGTTMVSSNYIRLTRDVQSQQGSIWNKVPVRMYNWEVQIQFKVHGTGKDLFGDGFAIWYTKDALQPGPVFGSRDHFQGLGVFLDTYANQNGHHNHAHPYISAMINNGSLTYDHDRDGTHTELAGCEAKFRNSDYDTSISIRYEHDTLVVSTDIMGKKEWNECFRVTGVRLPTKYHFGVSAATGDLSDHHDIIGIKVFELDGNDAGEVELREFIVPQAEHFAPHRDHIDDSPQSMSGTKFFFVVLFSMLFLMLCGIGIWYFYQKHQEKARKRFY